MGTADDIRDEAEERDRDERGVRQRIEGMIPELVKRTFTAGLGAVFATEEGVRKIASEFSLPKDVAGHIISGAQATKDEILRIFARELREFLQNMNLTEELARLLTTLSFEIKTEVRFIPNQQSVAGVKRDIKHKVSVKRVRDDGSEAVSELEPETSASSARPDAGNAKKPGTRSASTR